MTEVIGVRFRGGCKEYYFDPHGIAVEAGQFVIVETAQGTEYAQCLTGNHEVDDGAVVRPLRALVRIATENDRRTMEYNRQREKDAFGICQRKIAERGLDMKLVRVECSFDGSKIVFFFTSEGRVDFRELVRDLAGVFRARIELRQIGVRDEAKMLGGLGICGRPFCCAQFLDDFVPVSIKMAKTQNLSLNPTKISGACGRLMCCLKYEQAAYEAGRLVRGAEELSRLRDPCAAQRQGLARGHRDPRRAPRPLRKAGRGERAGCCSLARVPRAGALRARCSRCAGNACRRGER